MIAELKDLIIKIEQLEVEDQRQIAKMLTDEIMWKATLKNSAGKLEFLAKEAIEDYRNGKTKRTDW
ncbi:hypothetical protein [Daejeonella sp.]|uniref:hypothetical protein n=1 Tax=Daejeonella sp. TaxID=2805397 RepID=UPI0027253DA7|nr:hypothetical protein [Daejeonella sp.]MDO8993252.1 hypothetical protein [Daejeonella sp.]MDP2414627.1 hypothetical protein [Daejeonella sp.]